MAFVLRSHAKDVAFSSLSYFHKISHTGRQKCYTICQRKVVHTQSLLPFSRFLRTSVRLSFPGKNSHEAEEIGLELPKEAAKENPERVDQSERFFIGDEVLQQGIPKDNYIAMSYKVTGEVLSTLNDMIPEGDIERLDLTKENVTLPVALMLVDPDKFASFSRARKSCRKGAIIIHRGPLSPDETGEETVFDQDKMIRGRVINRVYPGDVIGYQVRMRGGFYPDLAKVSPPFELPVVYEDDHFAIVNKPAGVVTFARAASGHGSMALNVGLPYALRPPKKGTTNILRRPRAVHRLDKPTSGLVIAAKTIPAITNLSAQFVARKVKKTYTAIVNGIPAEEPDRSILSSAAAKMGVDIDPDDAGRWQFIENSLDGKEAISFWKPLSYSRSLKATDGILTLVEVKPKSGRYHQIRRHMAWVCGTPLIGDKEYDGGGLAMSLRGRGLFLCSNRVVLEHPYFNTEQGRREWEAMENDEKFASGALAVAHDGTVLVQVSIDLPEKFENMLNSEDRRAEKFQLIHEEKVRLPH